MKKLISVLVLVFGLVGSMFAFDVNTADIKYDGTEAVAEVGPMINLGSVGNVEFWLNPKVNAGAMFDQGFASTGVVGGASITAMEVLTRFNIYFVEEASGLVGKFENSYIYGCNANIGVGYMWSTVKIEASVNKYFLWRQWDNNYGNSNDLRSPWSISISLGLIW